MADNLVFEESVQSSIESNEFISKKWVYVNDNNNGNYTSQTVIDTTPLANSGGYVGWSEGYILMPLLMELTAVSGGGGVITNNSANCLYSVGLKNGFWQLLHSMTVEFNNQSVVQQTPFLNVFRSFKAMTSFSQDDVLNHGSEIGFYPDNMGSWSWDSANTASPSGAGLRNNRNSQLLIAETQIGGSSIAGLGTSTVTSYLASSACGSIVNDLSPNPSPFINSGYAFNEGLLRRQEFVGYSNATSNSQATMNSIDVCEAVYRSHCKVSSNSALWKIYAKLRLKDLHDFFEKMPLLKGSTIRIYLNTNQALCSFAVSADTPTGGVISAGNLTLSSAPQVNGGSTCPIIIASKDVGNGSNGLTAGTYQVSLSIVRNNFSQSNKQSGVQTGLTSCRLYAPIYKFTPIKEQQYLSMVPTKTVKYNDIFQYQYDLVNANTDFNFLVSNGISNIKSVLVVPFVNQLANLAIAGGLSTLISPFTTSGGTPDPITLTNFNIMISGVNLFLNDEQYDWEAFAHELAQSNQLNGNQTTSLTSGLISQDQFSRGYRYYYGNCSRILPAEAGVSRSVQIKGRNASLCNCSLMVFVEYEREIQIDLTTGARIS